MTVTEPEAGACCAVLIGKITVLLHDQLNDRYRLKRSCVYTICECYIELLFPSVKTHLGSSPNTILKKKAFLILRRAAQPYAYNLYKGETSVSPFCAPSMGAILEVEVLPRADHSERSETQLREGDQAWRGSG